jgi:Ca2+-binding RTX toxin-like protein
MIVSGSSASQAWADVIEGTEGPDVITGTPGDDQIDSKGGDDSIRGDPSSVDSFGIDIIISGEGDDGNY